MSYSGRTERVVMFCHNLQCKELNVEQEFRWSGATWDDPGEWVEEPYCRACGKQCHENEYEEEDAA